MKKLGLFLLAVVLMVGVAGCSSDDSNDNPVVGTWTTKWEDVTFVLTVKGDNTYTLTDNGVASDAGTWSVDGNVLTIIHKDSSKDMLTYSVNGNQLTINFSEGPLVYTRV